MAASTQHGSAVNAFFDSVDPRNRHVFLQPSSSIPYGSLEIVKQTLDAFAGQVSDEQQLRLRAATKKRRREGGDRADALKIRKLHIEGFETGQVWQQAKRIITNTLQQADELLAELQHNDEVELDANGEASHHEVGTASESEGDLQSGDSESQTGDDLASSEDGAEDLETVSEDEEFEGLEDEGCEQEGEDEEDDDGMEDGDSDEDEDDDTNERSAEYDAATKTLNDEFFSLAEFNKQSQWFEDQDARGDPNTDQVSDDEDLDWHADPMAVPDPKSRERSKKEDEEEGDEDFDMGENDEDSEEDDGPVFEDMDLYAPEGASDDEADGSEGGGLDEGMDFTANDIYYKDFFAPPQRKGKRVNKRKKNMDLPEISRPDDNDVNRAMDLVKRDLFDDGPGDSDSEDVLSDASTGEPKSRRSTHERQQAKLAEEIRKLEAELVAKRAWTLSGEAAAADRPVNSLLEEDLDFEHAGKPIPVVTEEVSESIEAMIKRRILAQEFDEVIKRRPDALGNAGTRRGLVDVDDTKAKQSLAEIYEEEHVKNTNPDTYVSKADEKLALEEKEVERMWKDVSARLDALSSWHFKPKPAEPTLTVVADVATVSMEDAQPTTAQGVSGGESMLAPQEVYKAGKETAEQGEIVAKSGLPIAKQEMSREEKQRRHRREKERIRKRGGDGRSNPSQKAQIRDETMKDLKKGGAMVINRKGEMVGMDGKAATGPKVASTSGSYKL